MKRFKDSVFGGHGMYAIEKNLKEDKSRLYEDDFKETIAEGKQVINKKFSMEPERKHLDSLQNRFKTVNKDSKSNSEINFRNRINRPLPNTQLNTKGLNLNKDLFKQEPNGLWRNMKTGRLFRLR